jgi:hypothetical protein
MDVGGRKIGVAWDPGSDVRNLDSELSTIPKRMVPVSLGCYLENAYGPAGIEFTPTDVDLPIAPNFSLGIPTAVSRDEIQTAITVEIADGYAVPPSG